MKLRNGLILAVFLLLTGCASLFGSPATITVSRGDTLYNIARRYDVPLRDLIDTNSLRPPYTLKVGQILRLPANNYHIVSRGDTLFSISRQYNIDVVNLKQMNGLEAPYTLNVGQRILLSRTNSGLFTNRSSQPSRNNYTVSAAPRTQTTSSPAPSYTVAQKRNTKFTWPVQGQVVSKFGTLGKGRANDGINIKAAHGAPVKAADGGTVAYAGSELKGFGNLILIRHSDGWITAYAHNDRLLVKKGQKVQKGEKIAMVGNTGGVNSPQLHFEVRAGKKPVNPMFYLP